MFNRGEKEVFILARYLYIFYYETVNVGTSVYTIEEERLARRSEPLRNPPFSRLARFNRPQ